MLFQADITTCYSTSCFSGNGWQICEFFDGGEEPAYSILPQHLASYTPTFSTPYIISPPSLTLTHWAEPASTDIAQLLQQQLQDKLHIDIHLQGYDWNTYIHKLHNGEFELITAARYPIANHPLPQLEYLTTLDWKNETFSKLLYQSKSLEKAEQLAMKGLPIIPLFYLAFKYLKNNKLKSEVLSPIGAMEIKWLEWEKDEQP